MDLEKIALNIKKGANGIYFSGSRSEIFYPDDGNEKCLQIEEESFWFAHRNNIISEGVKLFNEKTHSFFDIGGGNGFVAKRLQDDGTSVVLVEPGERGAINAYNRGITNVVCSTLEDASFKPNSVESAGLFDVVEHIEDDTAFLHNIHSYMSNGGHIYITVPAYKFLWSNEDNDAGHHRRYTINQLGRLLNDTGFEVVYSTYIFSILPLPIFLFRSLPSKLGLRRDSESLEKHQNEHKSREGFFDRLLQKIWKWELSRVQKGRSVPFGGSCFIIGRRKQHN